ncbi:hypothetical protein CC99x_005690 [Candidatus Berkiella cookevillensis]|uniref:Uncharacterized protein n=1 Tax=Candidatus Berkiella cookevillensis TaxID=437022 RepID=A0A0Q9YHH5_9GAMM|nr:hypothetical protein [Candidatus Berkiella cookevillensis]MCS5708395.1 hypothetical protein [Candidatus Berkiella cookevillensis]
MKKLYKILSLSITLLLSVNANAADFYNAVASSIKTHKASENTRTELLSILDQCGGSPDSMDADCVLVGLQDNTIKKNDSTTPQQIIESYRAIMTTDMQRTECINDELIAANYALGSCVLALNFFVLDSNEAESVHDEIYRCLNIQMGYFAYNGNPIAQYRLEKLAKQAKRPDEVKAWGRMLKKTTTEKELEFIKNCY